MPTKHRRQAEKWGLAGYTWFPFDVIDWLTSLDVQTMGMSDRGVYITLLAVQWRDGSLAADPKHLAKQSGIDSRVVAPWLQRWSNLVPCLQHGCSNSEACVQQGCSKLANEKLHKIAVAKGKLILPEGAEEKRREEIREEDEVVSELGSQGAPTTLGSTSEEQDQNLTTLLQKEQDRVQLLFDGLYPNGFSSVALFHKEVPHARACAEILANEKVSAKELLHYNKTHKSGALVFRSCAQLLKALTAEEQRLLNDFVGHESSSCRTCKALAKKVDGVTLPVYRQNSGQRDIFGKGDI